MAGKSDDGRLSSNLMVVTKLHTKERRQRSRSQGTDRDNSSWNGCNPTCRTEEEVLRLVQMLVHFISDNRLCMSEGAESPFISWTHLTFNVIKEQREAPAAKLLHLWTQTAARRVLSDTQLPPPTILKFTCH